MFFEKVFGDLRRCMRCLLPETFPGIEFDEEGVSNYCRNYKKVEMRGEKALGMCWSNTGGKGERYDCLVPISDG